MENATAAPAVTDYERMLNGIDGTDGFMDFHKDSTNVALHLITTPIALVAAFCFLNRVTKSSAVSPAVCTVYAAALLAHALPVDMVAYCTLAMFGMAYLGAACDLSLYASVPLMALGYVGQDLAHMYTGEKTFQSTYESEAGALGMLVQHTLYLLPLVLEGVKPMLGDCSVGMLLISLVPATLLCLYNSATGEPTFPWDFHPARVLNTKLQTKQDLADLATVRQFASDSDPSKTTSSHWWYEKGYDMDHSLNEEARAAFQRIAEGDQMMGMFHDHFDPRYYTVRCVFGMNELYCTGPEIGKADSDTVFYTKHIDGPYGMIPFASLFRCIMASDSNTQVSTIFPSTGQYITAADGDCVAFDFHREPHFIQSDNANRNKDLRVVLKLHYVIFPKWALSIGNLLHYLSVKYNENFRALFLFTIQPKTWVQRATAANVVFWTVVVEKVWTVIGLQNAVYVAVMAAFAYGTNSYPLFLAGTSFVHGARTLTTCYYRSNVDFGVFKRDVILFKAMAIAQLAYLYSAPAGLPALDTDSASESLGLVAAGLALAIATAFMLGPDQVFSAKPLGLSDDASKPSMLRHLVLVGECVGLLGAQMALKAQYPYLVVGQIALNACIVGQDIFGISKSSGTPKQPKPVMHAKTA